MVRSEALSEHVTFELAFCALTSDIDLNITKFLPKICIMIYLSQTITQVAQSRISWSKPSDAYMRR